MGGVDSKVDVGEVKRQVNAAPVVVYTKEQCGFCIKAKQLLFDHGLHYVEHDLDAIKARNNKEAVALINGLVYMTRQTSVPQVFICGKFVGGFTELNNLSTDKKLLEAVAECSKESD